MMLQKKIYRICPLCKKQGFERPLKLEEGEKIGQVKCVCGRPFEKCSLHLKEKQEKDYKYWKKVADRDNKSLSDTFKITVSVPGSSLPMNHHRCKNCEMVFRTYTVDELIRLEFFWCVDCKSKCRKSVCTSESRIKKICQSCLEKRVRDRISSSMDRLIGNIPKYAYFLTHTDNLVHILRDGILAPNQRPSSYTKISNPGIVRRRDTQIHLPNGEPLNCYAHSYFRPNNAMLFNVLTEQNFKLDQIAIIEIKLDIAVNEYVFTPKNAAVCKRDDFCFPTADDPKTWRSLTYPKTREILETIHNMLREKRWAGNKKLKQEFMAECLIKNKFSPDMFESVIVYDDAEKRRVKEMLNNNWMKFDGTHFERKHEDDWCKEIITIKTNQETKKINNNYEGFFFGGKVGK